MALRLFSVLLALTTAFRPNVVIFFGDDWGWGDLGANHEQAKGLTDNLDALAAAGVRFTDFHVGASVCTPSRAALLTGRIGLRTGTVNNFGPSSLFGLPQNETTIAELLKEQGYRTGMIGKWHLGTAPGYHPIDRGFDSYLGVPYSIDMGCGAGPTSKLSPNNDTMFCPACQRHGEPAPPCHADPSCHRDDGCGFKDIGLPVHQDRTIVEQPADLDNLSERYVREIHRFISSSAASGDPFFFFYAASHMHVPQNHALRWENRSQTPFATREAGGRDFAAALLEMDDEVGNIVQALAAAGVTNNTLILITGDNGPWECKCNLTGSTGPFTGQWMKKHGGGGATGKFTVWEGGHRTAGIVVWPARISPRVSNALVSSFDFFPTIAAVAGASLPTDRLYDGVDISPLLLGDSPTGGHDTLFHPAALPCGDFPNGGIAAVRKFNMKAVWVTGGVPACGGASPKCQVLPAPLVFDLATDPAEEFPLNVSEEVVADFESLRTTFMESVMGDVTSTTNYTSGEAGKAANCCDPANLACACTAVLFT